ncbi:MAG: UDP-N-acetylmuramoyl-tripeptide--D-alanyl-D-alanine ligase [Gammaproteobacteria bacterium]|nr:UDP-N-acetylmuramoyl-tripeptide--D-alanyl-D-alanine ligase [Gammaproteobacteria bacterium]
MRVSEAAVLLDARHTGDDALFVGVGTDTRTITGTQLFVALEGPHHDGHDYLDEASRRGAAAAMVRADAECALPAIRVPDTLAGLGQLAAAWRARFDVPVIAVTGSNGKTTVKEMCAAIMRAAYPVLATRGNLNNEIGLPLTLLELDDSHRVAVVEMGANHPGEIQRLARLARPHVGVITQCAPAHLEGFGSVEGVARAKGELLANLDARGTAVINADDDWCGLWRTLAGRRDVVTFGFGEDADVRAEWFADGPGSRVALHTPAGVLEVALALPGRHNAANAAAATAAALALGTPAQAVVEGLESVRPVPGRLAPRRLRDGLWLIDDTYNANPTSLEAALAVLAEFPAPRWLVLGDMLELGEGARDFHAEAGRMARERGVERLLAVGALSRASVEAFGEGARHYANLDRLIEDLSRDRSSDSAVLVKGSRSMGMERAVAALEAE